MTSSRRLSLRDKAYEPTRVCRVLDKRGLYRASQDRSCEFRLQSVLSGLSPPTDPVHSPLIHDVSHRRNSTIPYHLAASNIPRFDRPTLRTMMLPHLQILSYDSTRIRAFLTGAVGVNLAVVDIPLPAHPRQYDIDELAQPSIPFAMMRKSRSSTKTISARSHSL